MAKDTKLPTITRKQQIDYLAMYGREAARASNIVGKLLRFTKGEYIAGQDNEEIAEGTKMLVNIDSVTSGWMLWLNKKLVEQDMGPVMQGFQPKKRSELSYSNKSEWPDDTENDPWQLTNQCLMKAVKGGDIYTFTISSKGGISAIGNLCTSASEYMREGHENENPIIELGIDSYKHSEYGKIFVPVLSIVGWSKDADFESQERVKPAAAKRKTSKTGERALTYK
jgi:hypothetical protein